MLSFFISAAQAAESTGHEGAAFPPFDTAWYASQLFWLTISFGFLYYVMSRIALPRMIGILEDRSAKIDGDLEQAATMQKKAQEAGQAYEQALAKAKLNAQAIGQKAKDDANAEMSRTRQGVEADVAAKIAAAEATIATTKTAALGNVSSIASDAASAIIERLTGKPPSGDELKSALSAALKN
jgi:F-type H+-transporting ATPase subunit b